MNKLFENLVKIEPVYIHVNVITSFENINILKEKYGNNIDTNNIYLRRHYKYKDGKKLIDYSVIELKK